MHNILKLSFTGVEDQRAKIQRILVPILKNFRLRRAIFQNFRLWQAELHRILVTIPRIFCLQQPLTTILQPTIYTINCKFVMCITINCNIQTILREDLNLMSPKSQNVSYKTYNFRKKVSPQLLYFENRQISLRACRYWARCGMAAPKNRHGRSRKQSWPLPKTDVA